MSQHSASSKEPDAAAQTYEDPHADAKSTLGGTAGPEGRDTADSMQTEPRGRSRQPDEPPPAETTSDHRPPAHEGGH